MRRAGQDAEQLPSLAPTAAEREAVIELAKRHYVAERLTLEGMESWVSAVYAAETRDELSDLAAGLSIADPGVGLWRRAAAFLVGAGIAAGLLVGIVVAQHAEAPQPFDPPSGTDPSFRAVPAAPAAAIPAVPAPPVPNDPACVRARKIRVAQAAERARLADASRSGGTSLAHLLPVDPPTPALSPGWDGPLDLASVSQGPRYVESPGLFVRHRFESGYARTWIGPGSWTTPDGRGAATVNAYEFRSAADAEAFDHDVAEHACALASEVFLLEGVPGSIGMQLRHNGMVEETVTFVRGTRRFRLAWQLPSPPADHRLVQKLAEETLALVDGRGS